MAERNDAGSARQEGDGNATPSKAGEGSAALESDPRATKHDISACGILILAAGESKRMGGPKALLKVDGVPLLLRAARAALVSKTGGPVVVVLGAHAELLQPVLADLSVHVVINDNWREGMGSSLRTGVAASLRAAPGIDSLIVALVDQPHFDAALIARLLEKWSSTGRSIVATRLKAVSHAASNAGDGGLGDGVSDGAPGGPPVLFDRKHFLALLACHGDAGARALLREHAEDLALIEAPGAIDLDTPEEYARYIEQRRN